MVWELGWVCLTLLFVTYPNPSLFLSPPLQIFPEISQTFAGQGDFPIFIQLENIKLSLQIEKSAKLWNRTTLKISELLNIRGFITFGIDIKISCREIQIYEPCFR